MSRPLVRDLKPEPRDTWADAFNRASCGAGGRLARRMSITLLSGDCRDVLPTLAANSVHTCVTSPPYYALRSYLYAAHPDKHREIGSESTPDEYLATMVAVFREVRRVLRPDGTLWLNIGDSYAGSPAGNFGTNRPEAGVFNNYRSNTALNTTKHAKPKDLLMMPARLALALQADAVGAT